MLQEGIIKSTHMNQRLLSALWLPFWLINWLAPAAPTPPPRAVVHAVLFYSPTCGHCYQVIKEVLPPLVKQYGDQLQIIAISVETDQGQAFFMPAIEMFGNESGGVPMLVVGEHAMVGSLEIPQLFPGLIEQYLQQGGVDWPAIPGLAEAINAAMAAQATQAASTPGASPEMTESAGPPNAEVALPEEEPYNLAERLARDPAGNALSIIVLLGMLAVGIGAVVTFQRPMKSLDPQRWLWVIPVLCLVGIAVAGYMAFVETTQVEAVCGPVGDCNTVQQSQYARLFGVLPIGLLGIIGYVLILFAWLVGRFGSGQLSRLAWLAMLGMTAFGLLFSIYLTFLEPFVIGASCAWCLTSAILMTVLFWFSLAPGKNALAYLRGNDQVHAAH